MQSLEASDEVQDAPGDSGGPALMTTPRGREAYDRRWVHATRPVKRLRLSTSHTQVEQSIAALSGGRGHSSKRPRLEIDYDRSHGQGNPEKRK